MSRLVDSDHYILCVLMGPYTNSSGAAVSRFFVVAHAQLLGTRYEAAVRECEQKRMRRRTARTAALEGLGKRPALEGCARADAGRL